MKPKIVIFALFAAAGFTSCDVTSHSGAKKPPSADDALLKAQREVRAKLISPGSTKFSPFGETLIEEVSKGHWRVVGWVDSQNRFGALLRTQYACVLKAMPTGYCGDVDCTIKPIH